MRHAHVLLVCALLVSSPMALATATISPSSLATAWDEDLDPVAGLRAIVVKVFCAAYKKVTGHAALICHYLNGCQGESDCFAARVE